MGFALVKGHMPDNRLVDKCPQSWLYVAFHPSRRSQADALVEIPTDLSLASQSRDDTVEPTAIKTATKRFWPLQRERPIHLKLFILLVPGGGVEPPRGCPRRILSPLRLPVPPSRLVARFSAKLVSHSCRTASNRYTAPFLAGHDVPNLSLIMTMVLLGAGSAGHRVHSPADANSKNAKRHKLLCQSR